MPTLFISRFIRQIAVTTERRWLFNGEQVTPDDLADYKCLAPLVLATSFAVFNRCVLPAHAVGGEAFVAMPDSMLNVAVVGTPALPATTLLYCLNHAIKIELAPNIVGTNQVEMSRHLGVFHEICEPKSKSRRIIRATAIADYAGLAQPELT